mmetsp:Transcript_12769/g.24039  ORF Transcript_12769/g.24039 Transcript_12769/m.24039 type:complete len:218 (-) Transcript_12769:180-833(-)
MLEIVVVLNTPSAIANAFHQRILLQILQCRLTSSAQSKVNLWDDGLAKDRIVAVNLCCHVSLCHRLHTWLCTARCPTTFNNHSASNFVPTSITADVAHHLFCHVCPQKWQAVSESIVYHLESWVVSKFAGEHTWLQTAHVFHLRFCVSKAKFNSVLRPVIPQVVVRIKDCNLRLNSVLLILVHPLLVRPRLHWQTNQRPRKSHGQRFGDGCREGSKD